MLEDANYKELAQQEAFEQKLRKDRHTQKSAKGRIICFKSIEKIFAIKYIPDFVEDRKMIIKDVVERSLKKERAVDQIELLCV